MRPVFTEVPATLELAERISWRLRASDIEEARAAHGYSPQDACRLSVAASQYAFCWLVNDEPIYLCGLRSGTAFNRTGQVWGLGTDDMRRYAKTFWPASQRFIAFCRGHVDVLENWVDVRNTASMAWIKRLGFTMGEPEPYGNEGRLFQHFWMKGGFLS